MEILDGVYTYPVFEANQVLKSEQLNELLNYLDIQDRLTRNKLIGSGIVCGFELTYSENVSISISKGCGLTSQGLMVAYCAKTFTHFLPYTTKNFPKDFNFINQCNLDIPDPILFYKLNGGRPDGNFNGKLFQLLTNYEFDGLTNEKPNAISIEGNHALLDKYAVVLFLETEEEDLKNCDTNDCNDKGSEMQFEVKALLVEKEILDAFIRQNQVQAPVGNPSVNPDLHHVELRRYNVPVQDLKSAEQVIDAFEQLVDDQKLKKIAEVLNYCFVHYYYLLENETVNPFEKVWERFKNLRNDIISNKPILIQYYYDFIDDVLKAYYEFKSKVFETTTSCCGSEMKFPLHLMVGEASLSTKSQAKNKYREYFIYSPLFNNQDEKLAEVRMLFTRLKLLISEINFNVISDFENRSVKITPSRYGYVYLSDRCIPYHYKVTSPGKELYRSWSYEKSKRGNEKFNLGYDSSLYCNADNVIHPLLYDIERFNFFRIEGHIGKNIDRAITTVKTIQQQNNLPFDIVALSADFIGTLVRGEEPKCVIQDLESDYRVQIAEFICKIHDAFCNVGNLKYVQDKVFLFNNLLMDAIGAVKFPFAAPGEIGVPDVKKEIIDKSDLINFNIDHPFISSLVDRFHATKDYSKGETLKSLCDPPKDTIGSYYLSKIKKGFTNPVKIIRERENDRLYHLLFEFIDRVETLFETLMNTELADLNVTALKFQYEKLNSIINSIHRFVNELAAPSFDFFSNARQNIAENKLLNVFVKNIQLLDHACFIEKLEAIKSEYTRRMAQYRLARNFSYYFKTHGGIEHKAGVPRGGTFILVYHEERRNRLFDKGSLFVNKDLSNLMLKNFSELLKSDLPIDSLADKTRLLHTAILYQDPVLHFQFKNVLSQYLADCKNLPPDKKKDLEDLINTNPKENRFEFKDGMVIADFYVPYICCSDCPPIVYMLSPPPKEETPDPKINIDKRNFCSGDKTKFPIVVKPEGGIVSGPGISVDNNGKYMFIPFEAGSGKHTLKYTLSGKTVSVQVQVETTPVAKFSYKTEVGHGEVKVALINESTGVDDETTYVWFVVGDEPNSFSKEKSPPPLKFKLANPVKKITLRASNGKCPSEQTIEIEFTQETERKSLLLCQGIKQFKLEDKPQKVKVHRNTGIVMNDAKLIVSPAATPLDDGNVFVVAYSVNGQDKIITISIIVPDANFIMEAKRIDDNKMFFRLRPVTEFIADSKWALSTVNGVQLPGSDQMIYEKIFSIEEFNSFAALDIAHLVNSEMETCRAEKILHGFKVSPIVRMIMSNQQFVFITKDE